METGSEPTSDPSYSSGQLLLNKSAEEPTGTLNEQPNVSFSGAIILSRPPLPTDYPDDVPSSSNHFIGKAKPLKKLKAKEIEKDSEEYLRRRQRNNVAVKKSREKTREKSAFTLLKVEQLKAENQQLEAKISTLTKELAVLKDLFMDHARGFCAGGNLILPEHLELLLGCRSLRKDPQPSTSRDSLPCSSKQSQNISALSFIEPLINAAEMELMAFKRDENDNVVKVEDNSASLENGRTAPKPGSVDGKESES